jgi:hypothetical protein
MDLSGLDRKVTEIQGTVERISGLLSRNTTTLASNGG